jgi:hypothetical protein
MAHIGCFKAQMMKVLSLFSLIPLSREESPQLTDNASKNVTNIWCYLYLQTALLIINFTEKSWSSASDSYL